MLLLIPTANRHPRHTVTGCDTQGCEIGNAVNPIINHPNFNFACLHVYDITHIAVNLLQQRQINGHFGNLNCRYLPNIRRIRPMQGLCKWIYHDIPIYPQKKGFIYATVQYLYFRLLKFRKKKSIRFQIQVPKAQKTRCRIRRATHCGSHWATALLPMCRSASQRDSMAENTVNLRGTQSWYTIIVIVNSNSSSK